MSATTYQGRDRRGTRRGGVTTESPGDLAERLYRQGWRVARITRAGFIVGGVGPHPDTHKRIWWEEA